MNDFDSWFKSSNYSAKYRAMLLEAWERGFQAGKDDERWAEMDRRNFSAGFDE